MNCKAWKSHEVLRKVITVWIEDYREANGLELDDFARRVNQVGRKMRPPLHGTVSDTLIYMLERAKVPRTHPRIAAAIATVCRATPEQYDSIVDNAHKGTWEYVDIIGNTANAQVTTGIGVVKIDDSARIVQRYASIQTAAKCNDLSQDTIKTRCERKVKREFSASNPFTFRYAKEWAKMTPEQKLKDIGVVVNE